MKDRSIEGLANVVMLPKNNSPHMTEWDNENNEGHDRARSQNKEKRQVKEEQEIKILKSKSKKSKTQKVPTIRPRTTVKNNPQVANISGTFKPPPRVTGRKDHRDVNESKLQKWELRKAKNIETQNSKIRSTSLLKNHFHSRQLIRFTLQNDLPNGLKAKSAAKLQPKSKDLPSHQSIVKSRCHSHGLLVGKMTSKSINFKS